MAKTPSPATGTERGRRGHQVSAASPRPTIDRPEGAVTLQRAAVMLNQPRNGRANVERLFRTPPGRPAELSAQTLIGQHADDRPPERFRVVGWDEHRGLAAGEYLDVPPTSVATIAAGGRRFQQDAAERLLPPDGPPRRPPAGAGPRRRQPGRCRRPARAPSTNGKGRLQKPPTPLCWRIARRPPASEPPAAAEPRIPRPSRGHPAPVRPDLADRHGKSRGAVDAKLPGETAIRAARAEAIEVDAVVEHVRPRVVQALGNVKPSCCT